MPKRVPRRSSPKRVPRRTGCARSRDAKPAKKAAKKAAPLATGEENIAIVRAFLRACEKNDVAGACAMLSENAVYHNIPLPPIRGRKRIQATLENAMKWTRDFRAVNVNVAAGGNAVLTERIDSMVVAGIYVELPVMGTFETQNGKITAWRDYFCMRQFAEGTGLSL